MRKLPILLVILVVALGFVLLSSIFVVDERQKAMVLQFGQVRQVQEEPGLGFKIPFIQNVVYYDSRIQGIETQSLEVTPLDDRRLIVDAFARWRISDVEQFRRAVGVGGMMAAEQRLLRIMNANVREALGAVRSEAVLSADRVGLMNRIRDAAIIEARALGVEIIDVRLKRADLPEQNLAATFQRMQAEREREAADERARGNEAAQRVRAQADRTAIEIVSEAERDSTIIRGEADAERNRILAESFSQDEEFFSFIRSLQAYEVSMRGENTTMMLEPTSEFFAYLRAPSSQGGALVLPPATPEDGRGRLAGADDERRHPRAAAAAGGGRLTGGDARRPAAGPRARGDRGGAGARTGPSRVCARRSS
jgi:modulator of FtsH protease HflC